MPHAEQQRLSDFEPPRPSLVGVLAMSVAAMLATLLALAVIGEVGPIGEWEAGNSPGTFVLDVFAASIAAWVDSRAVKAWRRFLPGD